MHIRHFYKAVVLWSLKPLFPSETKISKAPLTRQFRRLRLSDLLAHSPSSPSMNASPFACLRALLAPIRCDGVSESGAMHLYQSRRQKLIVTPPFSGAKVRAAVPSYGSKWAWDCSASGLDSCTGESIDRCYGLHRRQHIAWIWTARVAIYPFMVYELFCQSFK